MSCCVCIDQANVGILEKWGRFVRVLDPGFHFLFPCLGDFVVATLSLKVENLAVRCETKTKDNVFVLLDCSIQYRVMRENADDAFYELQNPEQQIRSYVFDVVCASVPKMSLDEVFEQKKEIAKAVSDELEKVMSAYGYSIEQTLIVDILPDASVRRAMNEINTAQRLRMVAVHKGEADKILQVKRAEAEAQAKYLSGKGVARQRQAITQGLKDNVLAFSHSVPGSSAKEVMEMVMISQYLDVLKDIGATSRSTAVFIPHSHSDSSDIEPQQSCTQTRPPA